MGHVSGGGIDLMLHEIQRWSRATFPDQDDLRIVNHLTEEVMELHDCVVNTPEQDVAEHIADCMILLAALADLFRIPIRQALADKHAINLGRTWEYDPERGYDRHRDAGGPAGKRVELPPEKRHHRGVSPLESFIEGVRSPVVADESPDGGGSCV